MIIKAHALELESIILLVDIQQVYGRQGESGSIPPETTYFLFSQFDSLIVSWPKYAVHLDFLKLVLDMHFICHVSLRHARRYNFYNIYFFLNDCKVKCCVTIFCYWNFDFRISEYCNPISCFSTFVVTVPRLLSVCTVHS